MEINLSDLNDAYRELQGDKFPDGKYPAKVMNAEVSTSRSGRRQVVWDLEVQDPATNRTLRIKKYSPLEGPSGLYWLNIDLKTLGVTLDHITGLHQALRDLAGVLVELDLEYTGDWYVVKFERLVAKQF